MEARLSSKWTLSTNHPASSFGIPVLVDVKSKEAYGSGDLVCPGKSGYFMRAAQVVLRISRRGKLDSNGEELVSRFLNAIFIRRSPDGSCEQLQRDHSVELVEIAKT